MYRDDEQARAARGHALIAEIADLERRALDQTSIAARLAEARRALDELQPQRPQRPARRPGLALHLAVFALAAAAAGLAMTVLLRL